MVWEKCGHKGGVGLIARKKRTTFMDGTSLKIVAHKTFYQNILDFKSPTHTDVNKNLSASRSFSAFHILNISIT